MADCAHPIIRELENLTATSELIHTDDTPDKIIEAMQANKKDPDRERRGMFTTGILAKTGSREIALYYSGTQHAGENLSAILKKRSAQLPPILHMCDALKANLV